MAVANPGARYAPRQDHAEQKGASCGEVAVHDAVVGHGDSRMVGVVFASLATHLVCSCAGPSWSMCPDWRAWMKVTF